MEIHDTIMYHWYTFKFFHIEKYVLFSFKLINLIKIIQIVNDKVMF